MRTHRPQRSRRVRDLPHQGDVDPATEAERLTEVHRLEVRGRACTVADAARRLCKTRFTVRLLPRSGELDVDPETDVSGARYITHESIDRYLGRG